ncbi:NicO-domain-containing protein [Epithele typhae]|uniref:NicO-domain-containing protein n=1 Tax=Epithele typhae TaxID=378194 RepID=UPI002007EED0|nr:NicO-domain-containing protein [Epithele typhae]KAH9924277.1 NicO-domain-containing protein [Epithele typhae]
MLSRSLARRLASVPRLTLFGRSALLLSAELVANAVAWAVCAVLFGRRTETRDVLSLALLSWTIGLRHALDADHISAIDNATRSLISMGQLPVTCGLFFSLGHSTIVIVVNVAIAISTDVYDRLTGVGEVGGIVGAAVSASFLFIVGLANSIILYRILRKRYQMKRQRAQRAVRGEAGADDVVDEDNTYSHGNTLMMKVLGPVVTFVDRPWKMYPVGLLFGFGFDTASSIALLAISAIAKRGPNGEHIDPADIVILPLLFTVGMTLIDSLDSILMLYSYAGFPERSFAVFERRLKPKEESLPHAVPSPTSASPAAGGPVANTSEELPRAPAQGRSKKTDASTTEVEVHDPVGQRKLRAKNSAMSNLSIVLTIMSIVVAFSISLITTMGLIGDNCTPCQNAANAEDGGGLAGRWWRAWAAANDNSGYIGAAIVGSFVFVVASWYATKFVYRKWHARRSARVAQN